VQHKPTTANDETHVLNSVESIVAVLLHEIAHTVHGDHEAHAKHSSEFEEINTFLVQYAQCAMGRASELEQRRWRGVRANRRDAVQRGRIRFDIAEFREMCSSHPPRTVLRGADPCGQVSLHLQRRALSIINLRICHVFTVLFPVPL
jgi:hypothetical protein